VIVLTELKDLFCNVLRIDCRTVVLKIEFNLLNGFGEHELVLWDVDFFPIFVQIELLINFDDFFEI